MKLHRSVLRFSPGTRAQLDEQARIASAALRRDVSLSAVVRAAVQAWLDATHNADPAQLIVAIRASIVARGRKPRR